MAKLQRAVLLLQPTIETERQTRVAFPWAAEHGLKIVSLTDDPWSALALIAAKVVRVVLVTFSTIETDQYGAMVKSAGGRLEAVYGDRGGRPYRVARGALGALREQVEAALSRGATPEQIALVLGLTMEQIESATVASPRERRPQRLDRAAVDARTVRIERVERPAASSSEQAAGRHRRPRALR